MSLIILQILKVTVVMLWIGLPLYDDDSEVYLYQMIQIQGSKANYVSGQHEG